MRLVIVESPYAGDIEANVAYARACVRDALARGEAPFVSHLLYTQPGILRDEVPAERERGIAAAHVGFRGAPPPGFSPDRVFSRGMGPATPPPGPAGKRVEFRSLGSTPP